MADETAPTNFIRDIIDRDLASGRTQRVVTRFPPEPNGYLHIGHAKSICLNFGLARDYGGQCHLRFDDTNPTREEQEFVDAIQADVRWLGFDWGEHLYFASDYFQTMYDLARGLIERGLAYVDSLPKDALREHRGSLTEPGRESPYRGRSVAENLDLFERMRAGEFPEGAHVLRAKIDMASPNMIMRDPLLYRIVHAAHHRAGDAWCIYPMYDYAHCIEDALEGITHSICTLEFDNNRELYDWVLEHTGFAEPRPRQYEFARLNLDYTMMSKRRLRLLVEEGHVDGWDDPRMPTIAGYRRRGVTPEAIRAFAELVGVARANSVVDLGKLEFCVRDDLNQRAPRVMAVLDPLKVVLTDWGEGAVDQLEASYWPHDVPKEGSRTVHFGRELWIERADFAADPPPGYHRLVAGGEVRLRYGYVIRCEEVVRDAEGEVIELRCSHDPASRGGNPADGRKVKGTIHWVSARHAVPAEVRLYDRLFTIANPDAAEDFRAYLNPASKVVVEALLEPSMASARAGSHWQFERQGYFVADAELHREGRLVFNRVVTLKDTWGKRAGEVPTEVVRLDKRGAEGDKRPDKRTRAEGRAAGRADDPRLAARLATYERLGLAADDADVLSGDLALADLFDAARAAHGDVASVAKWVVNVLLAELKERPVSELPFDGGAFGRLVALADAGKLSTSGAKAVLEAMLESGGEPAEIARARGLEQVHDEGVLEGAIEVVLARESDALARYREGKTQLFGFFVGQVMKESGGAANPQLVRDLLKARLG